MRYGWHVFFVLAVVWPLGSEASQARPSSIGVLSSAHGTDLAGGVPSATTPAVARSDTSRLLPGAGDPYVIVLGVAQDGGVPQAGTKDRAARTDPTHRRYVVSLAIVDPRSSQRWLIECTPDFPKQLSILDEIAPGDGKFAAGRPRASQPGDGNTVETQPARAKPAGGKPNLDGIFLTHAHIGHYTGLMHLGHEAMGAREVPVFVMPRMREFLENNGPWSQLVKLGNISLRTLEPGRAILLNERIRIEAFLVPHRQEYSEVAGFFIDGPTRKVLFIPDIDRWETWDAEGTRIEEWIARADVAYLDGTFFDNGEIPGRDMSGFPHPFIRHSMKRFADLPESERGKVRFIHLNHTNPARVPTGDAVREIESKGFGVAKEMERVQL